MGFFVCGMMGRFGWWFNYYLQYKLEDAYYY